MKFGLILVFFAILSSSVNVYAADDHFLDQVSAAEIDVAHSVYSAADLAELPAEARLIIEESPEFFSGGSIIVFNEDLGVWEEKIIQQAGLGMNICVFGSVALPSAIITAFAMLPTVTQALPTLMIVTGVVGTMAAWSLHSCLSPDF